MEEGWMVPSSECWYVESSILRSVIWNWPRLVVVESCGYLQTLWVVFLKWAGDLQILPDKQVSGL